MTKAHRDYFNALAPEWTARMADDPRFPEWLSRFGVSEGERVLDAGAGAGRMTVHLARCTGDSGLVVAEDFASAMLEEAKSRIHEPSVSWLCDDLTEIALKPGVLDKVLCYSVFPHLKKPLSVLAEIHRVLRPGGKILILHSEGSRELNRFHASLTSIVRDDRLPSVEIVASMLKSCGFEVIRSEDMDECYWVEAVKPAFSISIA